MGTASQLTPETASGNTITTSWIAEGYASINAALTGVLAVAPSTVSWNSLTLPLRSADHSAKNATDDPENVEDFEVVLTYGQDNGGAAAKEQSSSAEEILKDSGIVWSFGVGGGTTHLTVGVFVSAIGTVPATAQGVIGASKDGVAGVDVPDNKLIFNLRKRYATAPSGIATTLSDICGKVNSDTFQGLAAGQVLFTGAQASDFDPAGPVDITYSFAVSKNRTAIPIPGLGTIDKKGWEYLDIVYKEREDTGKLIHTPTGAQVVKVFELTAFSALGL